jgi:pyridoxine 5-phosphate synthase
MLRIIVRLPRVGGQGGHGPLAGGKRERILFALAGHDRLWPDDRPMAKLCVNIDHVATLRQVRRADRPDPIAAAVLAETAGAASITCHLREDRRHIQDSDVERLRFTLRTHLNLEMAATEEMLGIAERIRPDMVMFVPEKREEITTEGGLDVAGNLEAVRAATQRMLDAGLRVSHFVDPDLRQIEAVLACGAPVLELHTGAYANAQGTAARLAELRKLLDAARVAAQAGLQVNAGHGLTLQNVLPVAAIPRVCELHIGHSIVAHAVMVGFERATREMIDAIMRADALAVRHTPEEILMLFSA